jgi:hypothetical protein
LSETKSDYSSAHALALATECDAMRAAAVAEYERHVAASVAASGAREQQIRTAFADLFSCRAVYARRWAAAFRDMADELAEAEAKASEITGG